MYIYVHNIYVWGGEGGGGGGHICYLALYPLPDMHLNLKNIKNCVIIQSKTSTLMF